MSSQNQLSRWGAISRIIPDLAPGAKVFLVADTDDTSTGSAPAELGANFPPDEDGVVRVFTTIQAAVNAAAGGRGDVVLVAPGASLSLGRADTWATADVSVIGMGSGDQRPTITYDAATDAIHVGANGVRISNVIFQADITAVAQGLDFDSGFQGHTLDHCKFTFNATGDNFGRMVDVHASDVTIEDNEFIAEDTTGAGRAINIQGGEPDNLIIRRNHFYGNFDTLGDDTTDCAAMITGDSSHDSGDTVLENLLLESNTFLSTDTAATVIINVAGNSTTTVKGLAIHNMIASLDTTATDTVAVLLWPATAGGETHGVMSLENYFVASDTGLSQHKITYNFITES